METFLRYQTQLRCGNTGRPAGIFVAAGRVECRHSLPFETLELLQQSLDWFNQNLKVPSIAAEDWRRLFWFRTRSQEMIGRLWELVYLLADEGVFVTKVRTQNPGSVVYQDEHQVAAVPEKRKFALRV